MKNDNHNTTTSDLSKVDITQAHMNKMKELNEEEGRLRHEVFPNTPPYENDETTEIYDDFYKRKNEESLSFMKDVVNGNIDKDSFYVSYELTDTLYYDKIKVVNKENQEVFTILPPVIANIEDELPESDKVQYTFLKNHVNETIERDALSEFYNIENLKNDGGEVVSKRKDEYDAYLYVKVKYAGDEKFLSEDREYVLDERSGCFYLDEYCECNRIGIEQTKYVNYSDSVDPLTYCTNNGYFEHFDSILPEQEYIKGISEHGSPEDKIGLIKDLIRKDELNDETKEIIRQGFELCEKESLYRYYDDLQIHEIHEGLLHNIENPENPIDVSAYANPNFSATPDNNQMHEIRKGLEWNAEHPDKRIDVSIYAGYNFNANQMHELLDGLKNGVDVSIYADTGMTAEEMKDCREMMESAKEQGISTDDIKEAMETPVEQMQESVQEQAQNPTPEAAVSETGESVEVEEDDLGIE